MALSKEVYQENMPVPNGGNAMSRAQTSTPFPGQKQKSTAIRTPRPEPPTIMSMMVLPLSLFVHHGRVDGIALEREPGIIGGGADTHVVRLHRVIVLRMGSRDLHSGMPHNLCP